MKGRIVFLFLCLSLVWVTLVARAAYIQLWPHPRLEKLKKRQFQTKVELRSRRGAIFDRNGKELAVTIPSYSLYVDPKLIDQPDKVSRRLARELPQSFSKIHDKLTASGTRFQWIDRHLSRHQKKIVNSWDVRGLGFLEEPKRVYPNEQLLSQVLGFVGTDGQGLEGLELEYNDSLRGEKKKVLLPRDARGRPLLENGRVLTKVPEGADLHLTVDSEVQFMLESELKKAVQNYNAESAMGVVLDADTSAVVAMANTPGYNLNQAVNYSAKVRRNRVVTDAFEPGSTLKTFVVASALHENVVKPNHKYDCEQGRFKVDGRYIREADSHHQFGVLTVSEILAKSSNIGISKIAFDLGARKLSKNLRNFGFGQKTGIKFPGEGSGLMNELPWRKHLLSNVAFGQGVAATALQVANAYAAIANDGVLQKPYLVESVVNKAEGTKKTFKPHRKRRVLTKRESNVLTLMLTQAASDAGTGARAQIPGFPVAGKTGTAQKVDTQKGGYIEGAYIASFAGFIPANDPEYVIYVAVDNPQDDYYGSEVAAPVFGKVAQFLVRQKGLSPVLISQNNLLPAQHSSQPSGNGQASISQATPVKQVPDLIGLSLRQVYRRLQGTPVQVKARGSGLVTRTRPKAGKKIPANGELEVVLRPPAEEPSNGR